MEKVLAHKKRLITKLGNISDAKILDYGNGDFIEWKHTVEQLFL